ncbi:MAG: hypothetical protein HOW97_05425 [Catenulispora sp.]|nr:hypothetical protein [Catenulispora sp.]
MRFLRVPLRRLAAPVAVAVAAGSLSLAGAAPSSAATPVTFTSTVVNVASAGCMDDPNSSASAGTQAIQWSCNGGTNQNWTFTPVAGTSASYTVTNGASNLCLDVSGKSTADNAKIIQYTCNGQTNQQFTLQPVTVSGKTGTFGLAAVHSGKCIVPAGDATAAGTLLVQLSCTGAATRVWQLPAYRTGGSGNVVTVADPGPKTATVGTAVSVQISASDSASGQTLTYSATGLPAGLAITSSGLISGTPTTAGTSTVTVTATDTTGASGTASFSWTVNGTSGPPPSGTVRVFWLKPTDVAYDQAYPDGIAGVMREAQRFYKQQLGKTFTLNSTVVETVNGLHDTNWYITNNCDPNGDHYWCVVDNMQAELQQRFGLGNPDSRWLIVGEVSAEEVGQSGGGGGSGWVLLSGHDADGAAGKNGPMNRWYGGMVHELGHAFGLPDATSTDGTCMSASLYDYPNCTFNQTQKNGILNGPYGGFLS